MRSKLVYLYIFFVALILFPPITVSAHEVYVLTPTEIHYGLTSTPFNEISVALGNVPQFIFWAFISALTIFLIFFISISNFLERRLDPLLNRLRRYAAPVARVTIGISFLAAAYYQATYGPELPISATFGPWSPAVTILLIIMGILITFGVWVRPAALAALGMYVVAVIFHGVYMLTYTNYLGEILVLLMLGTHQNTNAMGHEKGGVMEQLKSKTYEVSRRFAPFSFAFLRVCFGISLFYASFYAKILHNNLALQVATLPLAGHSQSLSQVFGLEPHFLVLGAAIIEILIAVFFILGIEIRFTSIFLLFWLSLSLWWFGEVVWPHVILIGIPIAFILYGYDQYSLEGVLIKRGEYEPVL